MFFYFLKRDVIDVWFLGRIMKETVILPLDELRLRNLVILFNIV